MTGRYGDGLATLQQEVDVASLPVSGQLPTWLSGILLRNGPAVWDSSGRSLRHWFDGMAMLHRFEVADGVVSYRNRLLDTDASRTFREDGRITYGEFATDPCAGLFGRFFTRFTRRPTPNACVSVSFDGDRALALTETPLPVAFDAATLETVGVVAFDDDLASTVTTAHPHADPSTGDAVNVHLAFGRASAYQFTRQRRGAGGRLVRELLATVPSSRPGYVHSFAVTQRYAVLVVFPLVVRPLSFVLRNRPFIENYRWCPEVGTRIVVVDLEDGTVRTDTSAPACFAFHHINAYDALDAQGRPTVVVDLCTYPDAEVVQSLYLDRLRASAPTPMAHANRLTVALDSGSVEVRELSAEPFELPRIAYATRNGRPYRYAYGTGAADGAGTDFLDQLVKLDTDDGTTRVWREQGSYPGEPVFVASPDGGGEDAGVVLSLVLDTEAGSSYLLVLDAGSFVEVARAGLPHAVPFGFHGQFRAART